MLNILASIALMLGMSLSVTAQVGVTALIRTTLINAKTNAPLQVKYEIISSGNLGVTPKTIGKTNSEGKFENIFKPGETYTIYCKPTDGVAAPYTFSVPASTEYYEIGQTLPIRILKQGDAIGEWTLFGAGKSTLSSEKELEGVLTLVRGNRGVAVTINISDDMPVATKGKPKKAKKPTKKSKNAPPVPVVNILTDRINAITAYCTQQSTPEMLKRITIQASGTPAGKTDVSVLVRDFKNFGMD
ncbi:MAG: hypothetical protein IPM69_18470 [Ignavibacteria bacterium]|nr:hypothetical protein [Ignavibacteria bacterium]